MNKKNRNAEKNKGLGNRRAWRAVENVAGLFLVNMFDKPSDGAP